MSSEAGEERSAFERACADLVERLRSGDLSREDLEQAKREACSRHGAAEVPKNSELLSHAGGEYREELTPLLQRKPVRTASGVSPVAIMTSPHWCPHGKCLYCPGGPDSEFSSAQSYTGHEPAAARGEQNDYDPHGQVTLRLEQLRSIGHPIGKVELILMGGTMTARSHDYQEWFVKRALQAMNEYDVDAEPEPAEHESFAPDPDCSDFAYVEDVIARNETAEVRNVATTFETKPDWCDPEQIDRMLALGGTKVEVGLQTTYERINREMHRGHGVQDAIDANGRLRDAGFKVGFHMMPGQPGMSMGMCREDFRRLFAEECWRPDYLKIYPTLVVEGTAVYDWWHEDEFEPLTNEEAAELVADVKPSIPRYTRLQRVQRDIPADFIEAGVWKSNLRQLARQRMEARGETCSCIRCREVGHNDERARDPTVETLTYEVAGGTEHFVSIEDRERDLLVGFCRVRFPSEVVRRELEDAAVVRELHVYGGEVSVGDVGGGAGDSEPTTVDQGIAAKAHQHQGHGRRLIRRAEEIAADAGYEKLAVLSGIGVRQYYRKKLGYRQDGPYVTKRL